MENINTNEMELNNEETVNDTAEVTDTVLDTDEVIIAEVDSDNTKTVLKILFVGGIALGIAIAANWDKIQKKRYEKRKKKLSKEAAKYGETVFITKCEYSETETVEESTEVEETVGVAEN